MNILETLWSFLNSPIGITAAAAVVLWLLNRLYSFRPAWRAFEGSIIAAVKFAEHAIPDDSPNAGIARLDRALRYVIDVYREARGKDPSPKVIAELKEGIQTKHAELEAAGTLAKSNTKKAG